MRPERKVTLVARPKDPDRTDATRAQLRSGAITAFGERGFHGATIKDIATEAGLSTAAIYLHHPTKEDVLYQISWDGHRATVDVIRAALARRDEPADQLDEVVHDFTLFHARGHQMSRIINYELGGLSAPHRAEILAMRHEIEQLVEDLVRRGATAGVFEVSDPRLTATALLSLGVDIGRWYHPGGGWSPEDLASHYAGLARRIVGLRD